MKREAKICPPTEHKQSKPNKASTAIKNFANKCKTWAISHKCISLLVVATLFVGIVLAVVLPFTVESNYRANQVSKINPGDSYAQVEKILGNPYESSENMYTYYSKNYIKKMNQLKNLKDEIDKVENYDDLEKLYEQQSKLIQEIDNLEYKKISVLFADGKVSSIVFAKYSNYKNINESKNVKKATLYPDKKYKDEEITELYAKIFFADGGYTLIRIDEYEIIENNRQFDDYYTGDYVVVTCHLNPNNSFTAVLRTYDIARNDETVISNQKINLFYWCAMNIAIVALVVVAIVTISVQNKKAKNENLLKYISENRVISCCTLLYCIGFIAHFLLVLLQSTFLIPFSVLYAVSFCLAVNALTCVIASACRVTGETNAKYTKPFGKLILVYIALLILPFVSQFFYCNIVAFI